MFRFPTPRRLLVPALAALALFAALAGCSKKITSVDADDTQLEGTPNPDARLVVWPDTPFEVKVVADLVPVGPQTEPSVPENDTLLYVTTEYSTGAGTVRAVIFDGTSAGGFELFRAHPGGGFTRIRDFLLTATSKWLETHWEDYFVDDTAPGAIGATYVGRGAVGGVITKQSPLTNPATATVRPTNSGVLGYTESRTPPDSLFRIAWGPPAVPVDGYWIHVYQPRPDMARMDLRSSGAPTPVLRGKVRDILIAYVPSTQAEFDFENPSGLVLTMKTPLFGQEYLVRISAVRDGALVAYLPGDVGYLQGTGRYETFLMGAVRVNPTRPTRGANAPATSASARSGTGAFGIPGFGVIER